MPCTNKDGATIEGVVDGEADIYLNAYIESNFSEFGVPFVVHYSAHTRPYSLAIVCFLPDSSGADRITISTVKIATPGGPSNTLQVGATAKLSRFDVSSGQSLTTTIRCGKSISQDGTVELVING